MKKDNKGINENLIFNLLEPKIQETRDADLIRLWQKESKIIGKDKVKDLHYHLHRYTSINKSDYFIHKNLRKFLLHELDYFLKNEVLSLNFLNPEWDEEQVQKAIKVNVVKAGAIREIAVQIIGFLHELENFQKRLFEKKKFVVQSDYCMTLDRIPENIYDEIISDILNDPEKKQLNNWHDLGFINLKSPPDGGDLAYIQSHDKLVIDTQYLPHSLKYKLLGSIENLDEQTDGLMINTENWQGLNLIRIKYSEKIKSIYLDPPYNTDASEIIYKNGYKKSTWNSMIMESLLLTKDMMSNDSILCVTIDDFQQKDLSFILEQCIFNHKELGIVTIRNNPSGRPIPSGFAIAHEYAIFIGKSNNSRVASFDRTTKLNKRYNEEDEIGKYMWELLRKRGSDSERKDSPKAFYPIYMNSEGLRLPNMEWDENSRNWINIESPQEGEIVLLPIDENNIERRWRWGIEKTKTNLSDLKIEYNQKESIYTIYYKYRPPEGVVPTTNWIESKYSATEHGTGVLKAFFKDYNPFSYPKSIYAVLDCIYLSNGIDENIICLDYFAGSGTTAHAVLKLNKKDGGNRKYILMEMGEYFNTVTKPRIQKVMYSQNWKDGRPKDMDGSSHIFQYLKLEQYEDTLNNIEFNEIPDKVNEFSFSDQLKYLLTYGVNGSSCLLNIDGFIKPFDYEMDIVELNERKPTKIDLVTTFNYLLGIDVNRLITEFHQEQEYRIVTGEKNKQEYIIVWRNFSDQLNLKTEREWIRQQGWYSDEAILFCNADNAFGAQSTEAEFLRLMWEEVKDE